MRNPHSWWLKLDYLLLAGTAVSGWRLRASRRLPGCSWNCLISMRQPVLESGKRIIASRESLQIQMLWRFSAPQMALRDAGLGLLYSVVSVVVDLRHKGSSVSLVFRWQMEIHAARSTES
jgi:hypothetical protein